MKRMIRIGFIIIIFVLIILALEPVLSQYRLFARIFNTFKTYRSGGDISTGRSLLYARAIELWSNNPIFGNGWFYFYANNIGILRNMTKSHVHNLILELLCDVGVIGLFLVLAPMAVIYIKNYKALRSELSEYRKIYKWSFTVQTFFFLDSMLHVTFYSLSIITIFFISELIFLLAHKKDISTQELRGNYVKIS